MLRKSSYYKRYLLEHLKRSPVRRLDSFIHPANRDNLLLREELQLGQWGRILFRQVNLDQLLVEKELRLVIRWLVNLDKLLLG
jgi:hypothetical protein